MTQCTLLLFTVRWSTHLPHIKNCTAGHWICLPQIILQEPWWQKAPIREITEQPATQNFHWPWMHSAFTVIIVHGKLRQIHGKVFILPTIQCSDHLHGKMSLCTGNWPCTGKKLCHTMNYTGLVNSEMDDSQLISVAKGWRRFGKYWQMLQKGFKGVIKCCQQRTGICGGWKFR